MVESNFPYPYWSHGFYSRQGLLMHLVQLGASQEWAKGDGQSQSQTDHPPLAFTPGLPGPLSAVTASLTGLVFYMCSGTQTQVLMLARPALC